MKRSSCFTFRLLSLSSLLVTCTALSQTNWTATVLPIKPPASTSQFLYKSAEAFGGSSSVWCGEAGPGDDPVGADDKVFAVYGTATKTYPLAPTDFSSMGNSMNSSFIVGFKGNWDTGPMTPVVWPIPTNPNSLTFTSLLPSTKQSGWAAYIQSDGNLVVGCVSDTQTGVMDNNCTACVWTAATPASFQALNTTGLSGTCANWIGPSTTVGGPYILGNAIDPVTQLSTSVYWHSVGDTPHVIATDATAVGTDGTIIAGTLHPWGNRTATIWNLNNPQITTNLMPPGMYYSEVDAMDGRYQVGEVSDGLKRRAALWTGTAESYEDLSVALPTAHGTWAQSVKVEGTQVVVLGWEYDSSTSWAVKPVRWTRNISAIPQIMGVPTTLPGLHQARSHGHG